MDNKSYRIRTTAGGEDTYLTLKLNQQYDYLEVLSIKIQQDNFYRDFTSDYGVIVGRVIANDGLGVPNANISIFIPLDDIDSENTILSSTYPFTDINGKDNSGISYNLLTPTIEMAVGTFPSKQQVLDNDTYLEIYKKYYKYTTKTNDSGDYMIFGVPVGTQSIHMDLDLSNIGEFSLTPNDLIASGISEKFFKRVDNDAYEFIQSNDLESLPQIVLQNTTVDIHPLWGNVDENEIGITRFDFKVSITAAPVATFIFNYGIDLFAGGTAGFVDLDPNFITDYTGTMCYNGIGNGITGHDLSSKYAPGHMNNIYTYINDGTGVNYGEPQVIFKKWDKTYTTSEDDDYVKVVKNTISTNQGCIIAYLPCDQDKYITDEFGDKIKSLDDSKGIGTTCRYSMKIMLEGGTIKDKSAYWNFVIQNIGQVDDRSPFKFDAKRIYSVSMRNVQNRDFPYALISTRDSSVVSYPDYNMGSNDWVNCFLYFGRVGNKDGSSQELATPYNIKFNIGNDTFYKVETRFIDITDYYDILANQPNHYVEVGNSDTRFTDIKVTSQDNPVNHDLQLPEPSPSRNNNRIFMLGTRNNINNFKTFTKNIKK